MLINPVTLKTRMHGWTVAKVVDDAGYCRVHFLWYLLHPVTGEMVFCFNSRSEAEAWSKENPFRTYKEEV